MDFGVISHYSNAGNQAKEEVGDIKKHTTFPPSKPISMALYPQHPGPPGAPPVFLLLKLKPIQGNMYLCKPLGN